MAKLKARSVTQVWVKNIPSFLETLPAIEFPFERLPDVFVPERTILKLGDRLRWHSYLYCYLNRKTTRNWTEFDASSVSKIRIAAMQAVLERISRWCRHDNARPNTIKQRLEGLATFLAWADRSENDTRYETVLSDSDVALQALSAYHWYLRSMLQNHQLSAARAGTIDRIAIDCLSVIHDFDYVQQIEPLSRAVNRRGKTVAPDDSDVQKFVSIAQAVFDSTADLALRETSDISSAAPRRIRRSALDDRLIIDLPKRYSEARLLELACIAFAALVLADSGANLSVLREYEEPEDLQDQLSQPDRFSLTHRAIKFRAGGKLVPVYMTPLTTTRLKTYTSVRQLLVERVGCEDIRPFFIQGSYPPRRFGAFKPTAIEPLSFDFLQYLRRKLSALGAELPHAVTLPKLRAYKQQFLVRRHPLAVAATVMGHSVETAVRAYCLAQKGLREAEMTQFFSSLEKTVLASSAGPPGPAATEALPAGACASYGNPMPSGQALLIQPDCRRVDGCFFCENYRLHADERDLRKLASCRVALIRIAPLQPDSAHAERVYLAIIGRIDALLCEIKQRIPKIFERVLQDVEDHGNLTTYWLMKLQQLHLLGMLPPPRPNEARAVGDSTA